MENNEVKGFWNDAAKYGGIIGVIYVFVAAWSMILQGFAGGILSFLSFGIFAGCLYYFTDRRAKLFRNQGFTYGQGISFILAMMLFAGFVYGVYVYVLYNYISPEIKEQMINANMTMIEKLGRGDIQGFDLGAILKNPIYVVLMNILGMVLYGGFLGLFVAAFTKKAADPFGRPQE